MQSETGFASSHQLKSYVAYKCRLKLAARAVLSADAGLLVLISSERKSEVGGWNASTTNWRMEERLSLASCILWH